MPRINSIRVFEHQSIAYKGRHALKGFTRVQFEAFESYFQANEYNPFFDLIPYGVRFKEYVGAIQVGSTTIEVLPKAGKLGDEDCWQKVLLDMLKACHLLTARETGVANLRLRANSVLELYFELYVAELEQLLHRGLIKKYRKREGQQRSLKGSLVFSEHLSRNIVHKERFYTRHNVYDRNHLLHQVLHEALLLVDALSNSPFLKDRIGRLQLYFPKVNSLQVKVRHFDRLKIDRKSYPYRKALEIAKLLILNYRPDISAGRQNLLAIMFDMNRLWEEYVYRILKKEAPSHWKVKAQQNHLFWEAKRIRPDLVLENTESGEIFVIDTKWKVIDRTKPADDDLKQMYVYNHHWNSALSLLLYPGTSTQKDYLGTFSLTLAGKEHRCKLSFVEVIQGKGLRQDIGQQIFDKLNLL